MRRTLLFLLLATGLPAQQPKQIRLHTDPPEVQVYLVGTSKDGLIPCPVSRSVVEIPDGDFRLVFRADGYTDKEEKFDRFQFQAGLNDWPKDRLLVLQPKSASATLSQTYRLHRSATLALGATLVFLSTAIAIFSWRHLRNQRRQKRILALGGDPREAPIGPFVPLRVVGGGGCGQVLLAVRDKELFHASPQRFAVKVIHQSLLEEDKEQETSQASKESFFKRFRREGKTLEKLDHPNIVKLLEYDLDATKPYLVLEFIDGEDFHKLLRRYPQGMPPQLALELILPICDALAYTHGQKEPIVHRDIKPANLMVTREGVVKVTDYGLAYVSSETRLTGGNFIGTAQYAPVEAFQSMPTPATDQYAVGLVLYEMLLGRPANPNDDGRMAANTAITGRLPKLSREAPDLGELAKVVERMYEHLPEKRFPTMRAAILALQATQIKGSKSPGPPSDPPATTSARQ